MTDADLASRLAKLMCAAQHRYRTRRGVGCLVTPRIPDGLIDEFAVGLAPVLKQLAAEAAEDVRAGARR